MLLLSSPFLLNRHARRPHLFDGSLAVAALQLDAPAAGGEQRGAEAAAAGVEGGGPHAIVGGHAGEVHLVHAATLEKALQAGRLAAGVVEKATVAVDGAIGSLLNDMVNAGQAQLRRELGSLCSLHAVIGPENLRQSLQVDHVS